LQSLGELIHAAPQITAESGITFEFILATDADESSFSAWINDGLSYALFDLPSTSVVDAEDADERSGESKVSKAPAHVVRVELARLDELMRLVGELVISRSHLSNKLENIEDVLSPSDWRSLQETNQAIERQLRDLREGIMQTRMVRVGEIFERMQFVIRDFAREIRRPVRLELSGQETEIDKYLVERMMAPLLHLVRNALSHGLESEDERVATGKTAEGILSLRAFTSGGRVIIEVEDDGRGIDVDSVSARAQSMHLIPANTSLDEESLLNLICSPGFSTRDQADRASGRGVGMAIVQNTVLELGGSLIMATELGYGTRFTIELPLTLAIADALIASVGGETIAVPQTSVHEVIQIDPLSVKLLENSEIIPYRGGVLPLVRLTQFFKLKGASSRASHAFVVGSRSHPVGLVVDRILGQREIVVRAMTDPLVQVQGVAGATELGDGRPVLILDAQAFVRNASGLSREFHGQRRLAALEGESVNGSAFALGHQEEVA
jgi:two-component system chemotaxis sensor kinase CheA